MVVNIYPRLLLGDLRTGKIQATLPYRSVKWGERLNAAGPLTATLRPFSEELARYDLRSLTATVKQFMAIEYGDHILEAGPIWDRPFDQDTWEVTLQGLGLWSVFDKRKNVNGDMLLPGAKVTEDIIQVNNAHLGSIAREWVRISIEDNPYGGDLPIVLPDHIPGTHTRTVHGYNLGWLGDDLRELTKAENGPDIRFRPRRKPGNPTYIEWVMEHGAIDILEQDGPAWQWDVRVEQSGVAKLGVNQDGTGLGSLAWVPGSGQEEEMKLATQRDLTLVGAGYPWLEVEASGGDEESMTVLQSLANQKVADASNPWNTWTMTVRADVWPTLGSYHAGDWALVNTPENHPYLPTSGKVLVRILAIDGDGGNEVSVTVAPIQGTEETGTAGVTIGDPNAAPVPLPLLASETLLVSPSLILTS